MKRQTKRLIRKLRKSLQGDRHAQSLRHIGDQARNRGDWATAGDFYRRHLKTNPSDFDIWVQLGHAYKEIGAFADAEKAYAAAHRLRPEDADLWLMRGHIARLRGDEALAADRYAASAAIDGNPHAIAERDRSRARAAPQTGPAPARVAVTRDVGQVWLEQTRLVGWAADPDRPDSDVVVQVTQAGKVIAETTTQRSRPGAPVGMGAFQVDLSGLFDLARPMTLEVCLGRTENALRGSPLVLASPPELEAWSRRFETLGPAEKGRLQARMTSETAGECLSILATFDQDLDSWKALLASVAEQLCPHWTLTCVVNATLDETLDTLLAEAAGRDSRIVRIMAPAEASTADRFAIALEAAAGTFVLPLDAGVLLEPEAVFRLLDAARDGADIVVADEAVYGVSPASLERVRRREDVVLERLFAHPRLGAVVALRRDHLLKTGRADLHAGAPVADMVLRTAERATYTAHIATPLARVPASWSAGPLSDLAAVTSASLARRGLPAIATASVEAVEVVWQDPGGVTVAAIIAPLRLDGLRDLLEGVKAALGDDARLVLIDPHPRSATTAAVLARLSNLADLVACAPDHETEAVNEAILTRAGGAVFAAVIEAEVTPAEGSLQKLRAVASRPDVAAAFAKVAVAAGQAFELQKSPVAGSDVALDTARDEGLLDIQAHTSIEGLMVVPIEAFTAGGGFDADLASSFRQTEFRLRLAEAGQTVLTETSAQAYSSPQKRSAQRDHERVANRLEVRRLAMTKRPQAMSDIWSAARVSALGRAPATFDAARPRLTQKARQVVS